MPWDWDLELPEDPDDARAIEYVSVDENDDPTDKLLSFLGPLGRSLERMFESMWVVEELLIEYRNKHPNRDHEIDSLFNVFPVHTKYGPLLLNMFLYEYHAREIIERVIEGKKLAPPTEAEKLSCLGSALTWGGTTPPQSVALYYGRIFKRWIQQPFMEGYMSPEKAAPLIEIIPTLEPIVTIDDERWVHNKLISSIGAFPERDVRYAEALKEPPRQNMTVEMPSRRSPYGLT